ncbi:hypothetical protein [Mesorhizobium sp.]|uniref:hypothetical protein n=1 Tax=Mesorhizobium sp. TaxID=1871066 RepID=UPI0025C307F1|nr:hypothetical protein [Mesorhizobium sp.]
MLSAAMSSRRISAGPKFRMARLTDNVFGCGSGSTMVLPLVSVMGLLVIPAKYSPEIERGAHVDFPACCCLLPLPLIDKKQYYPRQRQVVFYG